MSVQNILKLPKSEWTSFDIKGEHILRDNLDVIKKCQKSLIDNGYEIKNFQEKVSALKPSAKAGKILTVYVVRVKNTGELLVYA